MQSGTDWRPKVSHRHALQALSLLIQSFPGSPANPAHNGNLDSEGDPDLATRSDFDADGDFAPAPRSFQILLRLLKNLNSSSPREPLGGQAFTVSPAQYRTLLKMELRGNPGPSDYSCGVVYYKKKTTYIHRHLSALLSYLICDEAGQKWTNHTVVAPPDKSSLPFQRRGP